jgi:hypothetical protein
MVPTPHGCWGTGCGPRIPVVALSAMPLESGADRILAAEFAGYIEKPIEVRGIRGAGAPVLRGPGSLIVLAVAI